MQHLYAKAIGIADTDETAFHLTSIESQISRKVVIDENVNKWLGERDVSQEEIESLLCIPKSLRSHTSRSRSHRSGQSSTSSARRDSSRRERRGGAVETCLSKTKAGIGTTRN